MQKQTWKDWPKRLKNYISSNKRKPEQNGILVSFYLFFNLIFFATGHCVKTNSEHRRSEQSYSASFGSFRETKTLDIKSEKTQVSSSGLALLPAAAVKVLGMFWTFATTTNTQWRWCSGQSISTYFDILNSLNNPHTHMNTTQGQHSVAGIPECTKLTREVLKCVYKRDVVQRKPIFYT